MVNTRLQIPILSGERYSALMIRVLVMICRIFVTKWTIRWQPCHQGTKMLIAGIIATTKLKMFFNPKSEMDLHPSFD